MNKPEHNSRKGKLYINIWIKYLYSSPHKIAIQVEIKFSYKIFFI